MLNVIRQWVIKTMMKNNTGVVQTLPKRDLIELNTQITAQRLMQNGVDPEALKNVNQVENAVNAIDNRPRVQEGIRSTKSAKVFDLEGKEIKNPKNIMGGKEINQQTLNEELMKTDNPYSDLVNTPRPKTLAEREAEVLARMEKENKEAAQRIRDRKADEKQFNKDVEEAGGMEEFLNKNPIDDDTGDFATGGRVGLMAGSVPKIFKLLKDPKKVKQAIDNIFPTGDVKYDATMAAESLVELNPKFFGNKLYDDLDSMTQLDIYDAVISPMMSAQAKALRMKKASRPEKTLAAMEKGEGIDMSDPEIAEEFSRFMKETDPEGTKKLKQTLELDTFDPTGRKKNADGGRIGLKSGLSKAFLEFLKKFKVKQSGDDLKDFLSKRQFMKDMVGNTKANERARELTMLKENLDNYRKRYKGYEFPSDEQIRIDLEKRIQPILNKGRKLNSDGGRIGYADGTPSFEDYLKERGMIEKRQNLEQLMKDYQEDMRRKKVMEQKQMVADGGRIGLKAGMTKRAFLKLMGGVGATIGAAKSGIFTGLGKGAGKQVAKEVVEQGVRSAPPPYFFELANKIKMLGKPDKVTYADRVEIHRYRGKNGDEYELIEDLNTGDVRITKDKTGIGSLGDKTFDTIEDRTILEYKKGDADVDPESGTAFKSADEYEEYKVEFDADGTPADATDLDAVVQKEIIEEATGDAPSIKKAGGGIARMLGE